MDFLNGKIRPMYCKYLAAVIGAAVLAVLAWGGLLVFQGPVLTFFGADASMLALAERYMEPIRYVFPLFLFNQMLSAFLRNDKNPGLATLGMLSGAVQRVRRLLLRIHLRHGDLRCGACHGHRLRHSLFGDDETFRQKQEHLFRRVLDDSQYGVPQPLYGRHSPAHLAGRKRPLY